MKQSAEHPAPKLRSVAPKADRDLEIICARCLEQESADRYQSATELADDLESWMDDRPIVASPPGMSRRARRWIRRNRKLAASLAALGLLGAGSLLWQIRAQKIESAMRENFLAARSVVVLPFLDLETVSGDWTATRNVANALSGQFEGLGSARVSTSALPGWSKLEDIRGAAREARGRTVMTGTVRKVDGKPRLSLRLLDPASGQTLFATVLDETKFPSPQKIEQWARDIYKIITADSWSDVVTARIDPGLRNEEAAEAIKSGRAWMTSYTLSDLDQAITLFNKALAIEPNSSVAHAYLAMAVTSRIHFAADPRYLELGKSEALKALLLEPNSVEAHRALAGVHYQEGKFSDALEEEMRTVEMGGPEERIAIFVGMTLDILGRPEQALRWYPIASKVEWRPGETESLVGDCWAKLGNDERALRAYDRAIELQPGSSQGAVGKCRVYLLRNEFEAAREICRTHFRNLNELGEMAEVAAQVEFFARNYAAAEELYAKLAKSNAHGGGSFYGAITYQSALGRIKQVLGSHDEATQLLQESLENEKAAFNRQPENSEAAYRLAAAEASLDLSEAALQHLHQAVALGWLDYRSLRKDPRFDSLRSNPELDSLIDGLSAKVADLRSKAN
jgi:tetratricopeptide (TPR) repeat protein